MSLGCDGALLDAQQHLAPHHQTGEARLGRPCRRQGLDHLAAAQHGDPVGHLGHLVQLVADEDDRLALGRQATDDREQLAGLLWGEDGGRLVEHEDVGVAVEGLEDLDPLLLTDRDVLDPGLRIDREPEPLGDLANAVVGLAEIEQCLGVGRLGREDDVLRHRHHRDQHEVLMHHPHAGLDRGARRAELHRLAGDHDLALVGVVQPVEDVHQRRLAGTVLAEQRVDLALPQVEVDVVVRDDARKALRDVAHLEHGAGRSSHRGGILRLRSAPGEPCRSSPPEKAEGRASGPPFPSSCERAEAQDTVVGMPFSLPVAICFSSTFSAATIAAGTLAEILPMPTPPARTEKIVLP